MPKSLTTSVNFISLVSCFQRPGTNLFCLYPHVCWDVFQGVCWPIILLVGGRTCHTQPLCRCCHFWWLSLWVSIHWGPHWGCHLIWLKWIQQDAKVSWGRSWICQLSWSVHPLWRSHCWKHFGHQYFCGQGGYFAWVVVSITPYRESHLDGFCLIWSDCAYKLPVCLLCSLPVPCV